ncbi:MAG: ATP-binding cassette domain-containing protein, partial [Clostridiaceae bacterium]|nr:ATP-binding cassette domain-containing protein [Clostridiaceae bacterium]
MTSPGKQVTKVAEADLQTDVVYKPDPDNILEVHNLSKHFDIKTGLFKPSLPLKAVDDVSFFIKYKEPLGLVGESGCGKTTVGRTLMWLYPPTEGDVYFDGSRISEKNVRSLRRNMQMVFQDPYSSLNPRMTVEDIIGESLSIHRVY